MGKGGFSPLFVGFVLDRNPLCQVQFYLLAKKIDHITFLGEREEKEGRGEERGRGERGEEREREQK